MTQHYRDAQRPWAITFLALIVFKITGMQWMKCIMAIQHWETLKEVPTLVSPLYLVVKGGVWGILGLPLTLGLWKGKAWTRPGAKVVSVVFILNAWIDRLWIATPNFLKTRWLFDLGLSILGLIFLFVALHLPASKIFFEKDR